VTHSIDEALLLSDQVFVFATAPGRIYTIFDSPLAKYRLESDMRLQPEFGQYRAHLRELLNGAEA
jgi:NitT/TauT family transport system ATP-binding protein